MVHREKHSISPFKKNIYLGDQMNSLGFKYEPKVTAFLELQGEAKERFREDLHDKLPNSHHAFFDL